MSILFRGATTSQNFSATLPAFAAGDCNASFRVACPLAGETFSAIIDLSEATGTGAAIPIGSWVIAPAAGAVPGAAGVAGGGAAATGYLDKSGAYIFQRSDFWIHGGAQLIGTITFTAGTSVNGVTAELVF